MSAHTNMAITSSLVQEWPNRPTTFPFSQSIYIVATTVETVTVRYYPHGTTKPPHKISEIRTATTSTTSPRSMQVFPFSLTRFPTSLKSTYTTSTSGTTFITVSPGTFRPGPAMTTDSPHYTNPLPTTTITMKTIITRVETVTEVWTKKPAPLPYTLIQKAQARVTQSQYYLAPDGQTTSKTVVYWTEHYSPIAIVTAL